MIHKVLILFLVVVFFSCTEAKQQTIPDKPKVVFSPVFEGLEAFLNYQEKIDQRKDLKKIPSLLFTHKSGFTLQSTAYLDSNNEILKATLTRIDTNSVETNSTFYFLKGVLSMVQLNKQNLRSSKLLVHLTRIFYDAGQRPIAAYEQKVGAAHKSGVFKRVALGATQHNAIQQDLNYLSEMQNQEETFSLYFQGFEEAFNKKFVQFGNERFSTNLAYASNESMLVAIEKNPSGYAKQLFTIQYQPVQEASGLQYQVLTSIQTN